MALNDIINARNVGPDDEKIVLKEVSPTQQMEISQITLGEAQKVAVKDSSARMLRSLSKIASATSSIFETSGKLAIGTPQTEGEQTRERNLYNQEMNHLLDAGTSVSALDGIQPDENGKRWHVIKTGVNPDGSDATMRWNLDNPSDLAQARLHVYTSSLDGKEFKSRRAIKEYNDSVGSHTESIGTSKKESAKHYLVNMTHAWEKARQQYGDTEQAFRAWNNDPNVRSGRIFLGTLANHPHYADENLGWFQLQQEITEQRTRNITTSSVEGNRAQYRDYAYDMERAVRGMRRDDPSAFPNSLMDTMLNLGIDTSDPNFMEALGIGKERGIIDGGVFDTVVSQPDREKSWENFFRVIITHAIPQPEGLHPGPAGQIQEDIIRGLLAEIPYADIAEEFRGERERTADVFNLAQKDGTLLDVRTTLRNEDAGVPQLNAAYGQHGKSLLTNDPTLINPDSMKSFVELYILTKGSNNPNTNDWSFPDVVNKTLSGSYFQTTGVPIFSSLKWMKDNAHTLLLSSAGAHRLNDSGQDWISETSDGTGYVLTQKGAEHLWNQRNLVLREVRLSTPFLKMAANQLKTNVENVPDSDRAGKEEALMSFLGLVTGKTYNKDQTRKILQDMGALSDPNLPDDVKRDFFNNMGIPDLDTDAANTAREIIERTLSKTDTASKAAAARWKSTYGNDAFGDTHADLNAEGFQNLFSSGGMSEADFGILDAIDKVYKNALEERAKWVDHPPAPGEDVDSARRKYAHKVLLEYINDILVKPSEGVITLDRAIRMWSAYRHTKAVFDAQLSLLGSKGHPVDDIEFSPEVVNRDRLTLANYARNPNGIFDADEYKEGRLVPTPEYIQEVAWAGTRVHRALTNTRQTPEDSAALNEFIGSFIELSTLDHTQSSIEKRQKMAAFGIMAELVKNYLSTEDKMRPGIPVMYDTTMDADGNFTEKVIERPHQASSQSLLRHMLSPQNMDNTTSGTLGMYLLLNAATNIFHGDPSPEEMHRRIQEGELEVFKVMYIGAQLMARDGEFALPSGFSLEDLTTNIKGSGFIIDNERTGHQNLTSWFRTMTNSVRNDSFNIKNSFQLKLVWANLTGRQNMPTLTYIREGLEAVANSPEAANTWAIHPKTGKLTSIREIAADREWLSWGEQQRRNWDPWGGSDAHKSAKLGYMVKESDQELGDHDMTGVGAERWDDIMISGQDSWWWDGINIYDGGVEGWTTGVGSLMNGISGLLMQRYNTQVHQLGDRNTVLGTRWMMLAGTSAELAGEANNVGAQSIPTLFDFINISNDVGGQWQGGQISSGRTGHIIPSSDGLYTIDRNLSEAYLISRDGSSLLGTLGSKTSTPDTIQFNIDNDRNPHASVVNAEESIYLSWALTAPGEGNNVGASRFDHVMGILFKVPTVSPISQDVNKIILDMAMNPDMPNFEFYSIVNNILIDDIGRGLFIGGDATARLGGYALLPEAGSTLFSKKGTSPSQGVQTPTISRSNTNTKGHISLKIGTLNLMYLPPGTWDPDIDRMQERMSMVVDEYYNPEDGRHVTEELSPEAIPLGSQIEGDYTGWYSRYRQREVERSQISDRVRWAIRMKYGWGMGIDPENIGVQRKREESEGYDRLLSPQDEDPEAYDRRMWSERFRN